MKAVSVDSLRVVKLQANDRASDHRQMAGDVSKRRQQ